MEKALFFNSTETDRREYDSADFALYFGAVVTSGLITTGLYKGDLTVTKSPTFMEVLVDSGQALLEGHLYMNTAQMPLAVPPVSTNGMIRYDALVIRMDRVNRTITAQVIKGAESTVDTTALAAFPQPIRNAQTYDLTLARIKTMITGITITDLRLDEAYCGLAAGLIKPPTKDLQDLKDQISAELQTFIDQVQLEWQTWFDSIQNGTFVTKEEMDQAIATKATAPIATLDTKVNGMNDLLIQAATKIKMMEWCGVKKLNKDANGIFKNVQYMNPDSGLMYAQSKLIGTSPYNERRIEFYNFDNTVTELILKYTLYYDADGVLIEERFTGVL